MSQTSYILGNAPLQALQIKENAENVVQIGASIQCGYSIVKTSVSMVEDLACDDKLCLGLCNVATVCEGLAVEEKFTLSLK